MILQVKNKKLKKVNDITTWIYFYKDEYWFSKLYKNKESLINILTIEKERKILNLDLINFYEIDNFLNKKIILNDNLCIIWKLSLKNLYISHLLSPLEPYSIILK